MPRSSIRAALILFGTTFLTILDQCQAWSEQPLLSRRNLLRRLPEAALVVGAHSALADPGSNIANSAPSILPSQKTGVIWHAAKQQALPAIPATLQKIIHQEWFGTGPSVSSGTIGHEEPASGIVCISERHDDFSHKLVQLRCIKSLHGALERQRSSTSTGRTNSKNNAAAMTSAPILTVGMECFQRRHQRYLDKYINDPSYTLNNLNQDTHWDTTWGYDMFLYAPLLMYAKNKGLRLYGLHPTDEMVHDVLTKGVDAIPTSLLKGVVSHEPGHYEQYQKIMKVAPQKLSENPTFLTHFDRMYQVQCFREEYMAESVLIEVNRHQKHPQGHWTAVLAGENHVIGRAGIPFRALRRSSSNLLAIGGNHHGKMNNDKITPKNRGVYTVMPRTISFPMVASEAPGRMAADYVWYVENDDLKRDEVNVSPFRNHA